MAAYSVENYFIAIVCILDKELFAVRALFDERHRELPQPLQDPNKYALGRIGAYNVVAAAPPHGEYGGSSGTIVASHLLRSFPFVKFCLLVGIGGGAPSSMHDIRLGDVVVSFPTGNSPGVLQYDLGKTMQDGSFVLTRALQQPPRVLLTTLSRIKSDPNLFAKPLASYIGHIAQMKPEYRYPGSHLDTLYAPGVVHNSAEKTCKRCKGGLLKRHNRASTQPVIHYGLIASGNQVMKNAYVRDGLRHKHDILCFEMEAAGVMSSIPSLTIRGICDYADSHKNDIWQEYASATAAAYAKLLLTRLQL
ncbi:purine and uridine phosphorylase [Aspergillus ambiguus]|uniref:purine and uridine phosphorylase n=1 Tax=Aspergillus ambiguus TaxID=176160 RepID=UPI003CCD8F8B